MIVGLTGRYCAGKDTVARILGERGWRVLDADRINHEVLSANAAVIVDAFGPGVRAADGGVDRRALGRIVFADPAERTRLEAIVYPMVTARIMALLSETKGNALINAPLLHRAGLHRICDAVIFVRVPAVLRLVRAMRRDRLPLGDALRRIRAQGDVRPQFGDGAVDTYIVWNVGSARSLRRRVTRLDERLGRVQRGTG